MRFSVRVVDLIGERNETKKTGESERNGKKAKTESRIWLKKGSK